MLASYFRESRDNNNSKRMQVPVLDQEQNKKKKSNQRKETRDHFLSHCQTVYIYLTRQPGRLNLPVDYKQ